MWCIFVTVFKKFSGIRLDAQQILRDAELGGLPADWVRYSEGSKVLERCLPPPGLASHDELVRWFGEGLRQLRDAKVLDPYIAARRAKKAALAAPKPQAPVAPPDPMAG